ncbi:MAG TPA: PH domain-containing protein, partial [Candidatus Dormibacteraeota bacterium]|nr:PH domain-containing protein [Candidatus Dormibacteraeota bacterium]
MDPFVQAELQAELQPDEQLLWTGRPDANRLFTWLDLYLVPFSLFWTGFAIFWESLALYGAVRAGAEAAFFPLFGLPFIAIGFYLLFGRFLVKRYSRRHTYYAVTDRRVIALSTSFGRHVR